MTDPLEQLRAQFVERCRRDLVQLTESRADDAAFAGLVHRLAGAAGSFGFPELSAAAGVVDVRIRNGQSASSSEFRALIEALESAVAHDGAGQA